MTLLFVIVLLMVFPAGVLFLAFKPDLEKFWLMVGWLGLTFLLTILVAAVCWVLVAESILSQSRQIIELFCALSLAFTSMIS
jgi:hypothetical protein